MIALMMFLFLSGGAKKAAPAPAKPLLGPYTYKCADTNDECLRGYDYRPSGEVSVSITVRDGSTMVKLPDSEYSHLQDLRKAVADEEQRLALKYGATFVLPYVPGTVVACYHTGGCEPPQSDHYEFHGQFLLIEKAKEGKQ